MNRNEEYIDLLSELENTPPALEYTVTRARARAKKRTRIQRYFAVPVGSIAAVFLAFFVLVNVSTPFAMACSNIPVLRELASAVALSPSLKAAVDNDYVQPIGLEQTENDITMRVEYVIVDQKQLNVFYYLESATYKHMNVSIEIRKSDGTYLTGYAIVVSGYNGEDTELRRITADFIDIDNDMPDSLILICNVTGVESDTQFAEAPAPVDENTWDWEYTEPEYVASFEFPLAFDPEYTQKGEIITLNQSFIIDGQKLTATSIEIYPTHMRLNLSGDEGNTAWLKGLTFYLENEKGERFETLHGGLNATGSVDSPMMESYWVESAFFSKSKSLTLYITDVVWLDKDMERMKIDLANTSAEVLPEGVTFDRAERNGDTWQLRFSAIEYEKDVSYQLFYSQYYDEAGNEYNCGGFGIGGNAFYYDEGTGEYVETSGRFLFTLELADYPYDTVYLTPAFSRRVSLDTPVVITVK